MHPLARRIALLLQSTLRGFDRAANSYRDVLPSSSRLAPIFLIGAPRTGSTLFFQLMVTQFRVAYISNAMALAPRLMVRLCQLSQRACSGFGDVRSSRFGFVPGLWAPNEAGQIMRDWFDNAEGAMGVAEVRAMVTTITEAAGSPLLLKNQSNTLRLKRIKEVFPDARLLLLRRDLRWTAQSLLLARRNLLGDDRLWWSVAPPGHTAVLKHDPLYQVLWQADQLEQIALDACLAAKGRAVVIDYEALCTCPLEVMRTLGRHFGLAHTGAPPPTLSESNSRRIAKHEWDKLNALYLRHFADACEARSEAAIPLRVK